METKKQSAPQCALKCFGIGDGWPCADRRHSSFLYRWGSVTLLFDCGESVSSSFKATGSSYEDIDRIFISHLHFDHVGGFFMLVQGFWLEGRKKPLPVHLPTDGITPIRKMLEVGCVFDELFKFRLSLEPLEAGRAVLTGHVRVTPFATAHLENFRPRFEKIHPQRFEAFSFLMEAGSLRIGHSADIGAVEDLAPLVAQPLDLLVCELAHVKADDVFDYLRARPIKRILFIHLAREYWETLEATRSLATRMLGDIPFSFARDGEEVAVG